jgi:hypothetical protein
MTIPVLPTPQLGNTALDIAGAAGGFIKGLQDEKRRKEEMAMKNALLQVQMARATQPDASDTQVIQVPTAEGLKWAAYNKLTRRVEFIQAPPGTETGGPSAAAPSAGANVATPPITPPVPGGAHGALAAPMRQFISTGQDATGNLTQLSTPNIQLPDQRATEVPLPPGLRPRDVRPTPMAVTGPGGEQQIFSVDPRKNTATEITNPAGGPLLARATEAQERRARDAFQMIQGKSEMHRAITPDPANPGSGPQAYAEAANYISALDIGEGIPIVGNLINAVISQGQSALSPAAAQYFSAFMQAAAAQAFSRGGATLTKNEIDYSLSSLAPKPGEDPQTSAMRERLWQGIIGSNIVGNPAWTRFQEAAKQFGYTQNLGGLVPPGPAGSTINPRFDPRRQQ